MSQEFEKYHADALVALTQVDNPSQFGVATVSDGRIVKLEEKPKKPSSIFSRIILLQSKNSSTVPVSFHHPSTNA